MAFIRELLGNFSIFTVCMLGFVMVLGFGDFLVHRIVRFTAARKRTRQERLRFRRSIRRASGGSEHVNILSFRY